MSRHLIRVPATSANLGSGFDAVGMALTLFSDFSFEIGGDGLRIDIEGVGAERLPRDRSNLCYQAFATTCSHLGAAVPRNLQLGIVNRIPLGGGLGSSAAAIVGGVVGAFRISGAAPDPQHMLDAAARLEQHPDNIAPALLGGIVVGVMTPEHVRYLRIEAPAGLTTVVATPQFHVSTDESRALLAPTVERADAVFNLSRCGLLVGALQAGRLDLLGAATGDRLHQEGRLARIPGATVALQAAREAGALACVLSGSGPTVLAFVERDPVREQAVLGAIEQAFALAGVGVQARRLEPSGTGAIDSPAG